MAKTNKVTVIEKNAGQKIDFEQSGTRLIFGDDELNRSAPNPNTHAIYL